MFTKQYSVLSAWDMTVGKHRITEASAVTVIQLQPNAESELDSDGQLGASERTGQRNVCWLCNKDKVKPGRDPVMFCFYNPQASSVPALNRLLSLLIQPNVTA